MASVEVAQGQVEESSSDSGKVSSAESGSDSEVKIGVYTMETPFLQGPFLQEYWSIKKGKKRDTHGFQKEN